MLCAGWVVIVVTCEIEFRLWRLEVICSHVFSLQTRQPDTEPDQSIESGFDRLVSSTRTYAYTCDLLPFVCPPFICKAIPADADAGQGLS